MQLVSLGKHTEAAALQKMIMMTEMVRKNKADSQSAVQTRATQPEKLKASQPEQPKATQPAQPKGVSQPPSLTPARQAQLDNAMAMAAQVLFVLAL